ncbi:hypothetical protein C3E98_012595 [Pseudomonas sp. MWU13-2625]|nr:hypothetical protein C3E98_012595 [Pseudomonas sp. MWU13-2625]
MSSNHSVTDTPRSRASPLPQGISIWPAIAGISISDRRFCLFLRLAARSYRCVCQNAPSL